jgi:hypothetical protein
MAKLVGRRHSSIEPASDVKHALDASDNFIMVDSFANWLGRLPAGARGKIFEQDFLLRRMGRLRDRGCGSVGNLT